MFNNTKKLFLFLFISLIAVSCDDGDNGDQISDGLSILFPSDYVDGVALIEAENPSDHDEHSDEHADIGGFQLEMDESESYIYRQLGLETEGSLSISVDQTIEFSVHFLDSEGNEIEDHEEEEDDDDGHDHDEDHEEHGMAVIITGVSADSTSFQIQLIHDGHSDYTSLPIPLTVE